MALDALIAAVRAETAAELKQWQEYPQPPIR